MRPYTPGHLAPFAFAFAAFLFIAGLTSGVQPARAEETPPGSAAGMDDSTPEMRAKQVTANAEPARMRRGLPVGVARASATPTRHSPERTGAILMVTTAADTGAGSLRSMIAMANSLPGADYIGFAISGGGVQTITPLSALPIITSPVIIDGTSQPGYSGAPLIELSGASAGLSANGLVLRGGGSLVRGLAINGFGTAASPTGSGYGIVLEVAGGNTLEGNYIGTNAGGTAAKPNGRVGVVIQGTSGGNRIGGPTPAARNVLSGNSSSGIWIASGSPGANVIQGNYIGVDATGGVALGNGGNGMLIEAPYDTVGGTAAGAGNVVSANTLPGVYLNLLAHHCVILGNYVGNSADGSADLGNAQNGIYVRSNDNVIGDSTSAGRNVIGGNAFPGVYLSGSVATRNKVIGNFIGTDATGTVALGDGNGITIDAATANIIGGATPGARNLISGLPFTGITVINGASGNRILGNFIGLDATGLNALGNDRGILVNNSPSNVIGGGAPGERNVISANATFGVELRSAGATQNRISGNFIGTDASGLLDRGNGLHGILISASTDTIGGTTAADGNRIAFNKAAGVYDSLGAANLIRFNSIHSNAALGIDLFPRGLTPNDSLDADNGVNGLQNYPIIDSVIVAGGNWKVYCRLMSAPNTAYQVQLFRSDSSDAAHFGEGQTYLVSGSGITDNAGNLPMVFVVPVVPGPGFLSAIAMDASGNTSEFSQAACVTDQDGDGIPDCWETQGWGIDVNSDGTVDVDLWSLGARPDHKDLFVEIDAMQGYAPPQAAIDSVVASFARVPNLYVQNPDSKRGIALHVTFDEKTLPVQDFPNTWSDFMNVKAGSFGTVAQRADVNARFIREARSLVYRYGIWARTFGVGADTAYSGIAELAAGYGGNDFMVTFGGWHTTIRASDHSGTFMHEFGHTLGLHHGGGDDINLKPNYYSVMNYIWQGPYSYQSPGTWRLDYSPVALATLDERSLDENLGLSAPAGVWPGVWVPFTDSTANIGYAWLGAGTGADWTNDGNLQSAARVDLNHVGESPIVLSFDEKLVGHADWPGLVYNFRGSPAFRSIVNNAPHMAERELTYDMWQRLNALPPPRPKGHFVMDGALDTTARLMASHAGLPLYVAYRDGQLYVATTSAGSLGADVFILTATSRRSLRAAPLGKGGQTGEWRAFLANESADNSSQWWDGAGNDLYVSSVDTAGTVLEGVVDMRALEGGVPAEIFVAVGKYGTNDGGALLVQVPAGNGDANLDGAEFLRLVTTVDAPVGPRGPIAGLALAAMGSNPSHGGARVRLTMPVAAHADVRVLDIAGRTVALLVHGMLTAGAHELTWSTDASAGGAAPPGVYFIVAKAAGESRSTRVIMLR